MRKVFAFSLLTLIVTGEHIRKERNSSDEEMDDIIPRNDPIWWFIRSPAEELWLRELGTEYPRIGRFGEYLANMLQFILLGRPDDIILFLAGCPQRLLMELLRVRERIVLRNAIQFRNNAFQTSRSFLFHLNHLFGDRRFADERPVEVLCDLSRLFSNDHT